MPMRARRGISRFIVMAILQAARAQRMGLPRSSAYSWGLNRAIFYAAAKAGFKGGGREGGTPGEPPKSGGHREPFAMGDEFGYRDTRRSTVYFTIGDETQTEAEFEHQIVDRFGERSKFETAWREAERIVGEADDTDIQSGRRFYASVYKPRRDALKDAWTEMILGEASGA